MKHTVETLPFAPRYLGQLLYPGGAPIPKENHSFGGKSILDLLQPDLNLSPDEENFLKQYIIYYANAPMFEVYNPYPEFVREMKDKLTLDLSVDELISICMEYGLDPL